jgi:hypothetical protein
MVILASGLLVGTAGMAAAQNMASAVVPAQKSEFVVFADKGSATLSSTASATVRAAAREASSAPKVTLIGRAENIAPVKRELIRHGVAPGSITVVQQARAPIATIDGLSDPINRRVEIVF